MVKHKFIATFLLLILTELCRCQSLSPEIISSSGSFFSNGTNQLSWTLGEPVISTENAGNYILTQGFHQTLLSANPVNYLGSFNIKLFPNPTQDAFQVNIGTDPDDFNFELFDIIGRNIKTIHIRQSNFVQISLADFSAGNYLLKITDKDQRLLQTFKVQKLR
jgi:hypothetical protein